MKATLFLGLLASTSFASARIHPSTHALAIAGSLISGPWPALAKPVSRYPTIRLNPRQANSTTSTTTATYSVVSGDTPNADASDLGGGLAASGTVKATGTATATAPTGSSSGCGGHHHHHHNSTSTAGGAAEAQNGTTHTGHHSHNGTEADGHAHNSTSISATSGECNATSHHHHNGTEASGSPTAAATFFIPATATASALAVALTAPATAGDVVARAVNGFAAMLHRVCRGCI